MKAWISAFHRIGFVTVLSGFAGIASAQGVPPNVHFFMDTSGSMKELPQIKKSDHNTFYNRGDTNAADPLHTGCNNTDLLAVQASRSWDPNKVYDQPDLGTGIGTDLGYPNLFLDGKYYAYMDWEDSSSPTVTWNTKEDACKEQYTNWATTGATWYNNCLSCLQTKGYFKRPGVNNYNGSTRRNFIFWGRFLNFNPPKYVTAKVVLKQVIKDLPRVRAGISQFVWDSSNANNNGASMVRGQNPSCDQILKYPDSFDSNQSSYLSAVNALTFNTGTPLAKALLNIGQYFSSSDDVYRTGFGFTDYVFKSAYRNGHLTSQSRSWCWGCQASSIIIITDGEPSGDTMPSITRSRIQARNGGAVTCPVPADCVDDLGNDSMLDDVAKLLATQDLQSSTPAQVGDFNTAGRQSLRVHTIGFGIDSKLLRNTALVGNGRYAMASNATELRDALEDALVVTTMDVAVSEVDADCDEGSETLHLHARVRNQGDVAIPAGLRVAFYSGSANASGTLLGVATLADTLAAQSSAIVSLALHSAPGGLGQVVVVANDNGAGTGGPVECINSNNSASATLNLTCVSPRPPVALCRDITVSADGQCQGIGSVDNGSYDPDNQPSSLHISQSPAGPFGLGSHRVVLTASDGSSTAQCTGTITVVDATPPALTCPDAQVLACTTDSAVATYTAAATDNCGPAPVTCVPPSGSTFPQGQTNITCSATDAAGNTASCASSVTVQASGEACGPSVTMCIRPPYTKELTQNACGYVTPTVDGATVNAISFRVNGSAPISVWPTPENRSSGFVSTDVSLQEGRNVIELNATDDLGGVTSKQREVLVDRVAPQVTILSPQNEQALGSFSFDVTSQVQDATPTRVETQLVNKAQLPAGGGSVTHSVNLVSRGYNTVTVQATDAAGNVTKTPVRVWVDPKPAGVVTSPADNAVVGPKPGNVVPYTVRVESLSATEVEVAGRVFHLPRGGGSVQTNLTLQPGSTTVPVSAKTEAGVLTHLLRTVKYDTEAPVAEAISPVAGGTYRGTINLQARVTDVLAGVKAVGFGRSRTAVRPAVSLGNNLWALDFDTTALPNGSHTFSIWVLDTVGNQAFYDITVTINNG